MVRWPPRCRECGRPIDDWGEAGRLREGWLHKGCWLELSRREQARGREPSILRTPLEDQSRELGVFVYALLFHFGIGLALMGWVLLAQEQPGSGLVLLVLGLVFPVVGAAGVVVSVLKLRRAQAIRRELERGGPWTPLPRQR